MNSEAQQMNFFLWFLLTLLVAPLLPVWIVITTIWPNGRVDRFLNKHWGEPD